MASRFPSESKVQLTARKGHDIKWSCDKHAEPIAFQCKKHKISICHRCATKDHGQKPCVLEDIEDVILEMRRKLEDTQTKIAHAKKHMKTLKSNLESREISASNHLQSVSDNVNAAYDGKLNSVKDRERDEIRLINEEADDEIRLINEKRERRIKACKEEAEKQRQTLKNSAAKLFSEIKTINEKVKKKINELRSKNQHYIDIVDNLGSTIERMKQDDEKLVNETPRVIISLDESLSAHVHQEFADYLDRIESEVQGVKFVEGKVGGEHSERIDGYIGKWQLVKSVDIPSIVNTPLMCGFISDDEICVRCILTHALYVTNISTEQTQKVIQGDRNMCLTSCAPLDSNVIIVCDMGRGYSKRGWGGSLDGYITLYDRQWKVIRDINIPRNTPLFHSVHADVDMNGMILGAQEWQSNIYVINPADGKIVNTVMINSKTVNGEIQALSSGDIIVTTLSNKFIVISQLGEEKAVIHCDEWGRLTRCYVDKLTDTLYISYWDGDRKCKAVDQVSRDGNIQARRIAEYKPSDRYPFTSPCLITPCGNLVACDGDKLFVYKKSFIL